MSCVRSCLCRTDAASIHSFIERGHALLYLKGIGFAFATSPASKKTSERGEQIRVAGIRIVGGAVRIDKTEIRRVARIRRPLPPVVRRPTCRT